MPVNYLYDLKLSRQLTDIKSLLGLSAVSGVKIHRRLRDHLCPHNQDLDYRHGPEMSVTFNQLARPIDGGDCINNWPVSASIYIHLVIA